MAITRDESVSENAAHLARVIIDLLDGEDTIDGLTAAINVVGILAADAIKKSDIHESGLAEAIEYLTRDIDRIVRQNFSGEIPAGSIPLRMV